jgi:hypothetical protein
MLCSQGKATPVYRVLVGAFGLTFMSAGLDTIGRSLFTSEPTIYLVAWRLTWGLSRGPRLCGIRRLLPRYAPDLPGLFATGKKAWNICEVGSAPVAPLLLNSSQVSNLAQTRESCTCHSKLS